MKETNANVCQQHVFKFYVFNQSAPQSIAELNINTN